MKKNALILIIFMMISKIFGVVREAVLAYNYGASMFSDIYLTANMIPNVVFGLVATGLVSTFIPIYSKIVHNDGQERADSYLNNILNLVFILAIILTSLGLIFTEELVRVFATGFTGEVFANAVVFVRISLFAILANGFFSILNGYHQYHNRFLVAPISGFLMNFIIITAIIISARTSPKVMAYGIVISSFAQALVSYYIARKNEKFKFKFGINLKDEYLKPMIMMAIPIIIGSSIEQFNTIVDRTIASTLPEGSISILNYATKIAEAINGLFVVSISTVVYPEITKKAAAKDYDSLKTTVNEALVLVALIVIPATVGIIMLSDPIVELFFGRGILGSDVNAMALTSRTLIYYTLGITASGLRNILIRTFYAMEDSNTPVKSGFIAVIINIALDIYLAPIMGVAGLALATSISAMASMLILYVSLYRKISGFSLKEVLISLLKILFASIVMGVVVFFTRKLMISYDYRLLLIVTALLGVITYIIAMLFMDVKEFDDIINIVREKLHI